MVPLEDLRENEANKKFPGPDELTKVIETINPDFLVGVKRILLLDDDAQARKDRTLAQHRPIKGSSVAEIDVVYDRLRAHSKKGKTAELYALGEIAMLIFECLYTHKSVTRRVARQLSRQEAKKRGESFARSRALEAITKLHSAGDAQKIKKQADSWSIKADPNAPTAPAPVPIRVSKPEEEVKKTAPKAPAKKPPGTQKAAKSSKPTAAPKAAKKAASKTKAKPAAAATKKKAKSTVKKKKGSGGK